MYSDNRWSWELRHPLSQCEKAQLQLLSFRGNELDKENIWKYFEDREAKELAIRLRDVRDGVYQMKTYSINEKNGSVLDIWAEMEYESELTRMISNISAEPVSRDSKSRRLKRRSRRWIWM